MGTIYQGAKNAVEVCMRVRPGEYVLIVTDKGTYTVGNALKRAAKKVTSYVEMCVLEDYGTRPLTSLPKEIESAIPKANVTFWATQGMEGELEALRMPFVDAALKYARHGHMPGVTTRCMEEGMCSDYKRIVKFTQRLYETVKGAKRIDVANRSGTKLRVELNPEWRWVKDDGIYHEKGKWGNLPAGELFTAVAESNGQMVIDELGDWLGEKYGCLTKPESDSDTPVYINLESSRVDLKTLECDNVRLKRELIDYLKTDENSNRAGEFALPTNIELLMKPLIGNMLQDEKVRVHHAFGDPVSELTGANWQSKTHVDGLVKKCDVWVDGKKIMEADKYLIF
jgi:leucyl aminopeptidase (aminopeptidase T)